jgi:hypothetical protein
MPVLQANQVLAPFLSRPMTFVRGLDPLGLQNTTEATFTVLLPGLNNVSRKIRYYPFYCWLLDLYGKEDRSLDPKNQRRFIRRAELIVALVNQCLPKPSGEIPGTDYAANWIGSSLLEFDLEEGTYSAPNETEGTYWKNATGAFGQYYLGSMRDIGVIRDHPENTSIAARTKLSDEFVSGEALALAFEANLNTGDRELFLKAIGTGKIQRTELQSLTSGFDFSRPPQGSQEYVLLKELLIQADESKMVEEPSRFRQRTIGYLLETAVTEPASIIRAFLSKSYLEKGGLPDNEDDTLTGWYYYQLNEYWQYTCLAILDGMLDILEERAPVSWYPLAKLVDDTTNEVAEAIAARFGENLESTIGKLIEKTAQLNEEDLQSEIRQSYGVDSIIPALALIILLRVKNEAYMDRLSQFATRYQASRDGDAVSFFLKMDRHFEYDIADWVREFIYTHILYRHQFVAFRKLGAGNLSTQLFLLEEGKIRLKNHFPPAPTSPRLATLVGFLQDLGLLAQQKLTPAGESLRKELANA